MSGDLPTWEAVGVVYHDENFGKLEKWDRNERAKKRAEKGAIKKRYPDLIIPDYGEVYDSNVEVVVHDVSTAIIDEENQKQARSKQEKYDVARQAAADLGLDPNEIIATPTDEVIDAEVRDVEPQDIYAAVTDSHGTPYAEKDLRSLSYSFKALNNKINAFGEADTDAKVEQLDRLKLKRDAVHYYMSKQKEQANG
jgi:hypothetical protein